MTFILKKIALGNYTKPIQVGNKFLILNIDDIKNEKIQIDEEAELIKMIEFETNVIFLYRLKNSNYILELIVEPLGTVWRIIIITNSAPKIKTMIIKVVEIVQLITVVDGGTTIVSIAI